MVHFLQSLEVFEKLKNGLLECRIFQAKFEKI